MNTTSSLPQSPEVEQDWTSAPDAPRRNKSVDAKLYQAAQADLSKASDGALELLSLPLERELHARSLEGIAEKMAEEMYQADVEAVRAANRQLDAGFKSLRQGVDTLLTEADIDIIDMKHKANYTKMICRIDGKRRSVVVTGEVTPACSARLSVTFDMGMFKPSMGFSGENAESILRMVSKHVAHMVWA